MREGTSIEDHLRHMKAITDKLAAINAATGEEIQVVTLLGSLPESYDTVVTALETQKGEARLEFVRQTLINIEQKKGQSSPASAGVPDGNRSQSNSEAALLSANNSYRADSSNRRWCYKCSHMDHYQRECSTTLIIIEVKELEDATLKPEASSS